MMFFYLENKSSKFIYYAGKFLQDYVTSHTQKTLFPLLITDVFVQNKRCELYGATSSVREVQFALF